MTQVNNDHDGRRPMANIEAEQAVLGSMMLSASAADVAIDHLSSRDFYHPPHVTIFAVLVGLLASGQPTDPISLSHSLAGNGDLARVGGAPYLHTLVANVPTAANVDYHAQIVAGWARRRRVLESAVVVARAAQDLEKDVEAVVEEASRTIHEATAARARSEMVHVADVVDAEYQHMVDVAAGKIEPSISTGFRDLDGLLGGWRPGQLVVPAGRPGMGKSVASLCWALAAARQAHPTLIFPVEMKLRETMQRLWSNVGKVPLHLFQRMNLHSDDWARVERARDEIRRLPIAIDDSATTVAQIRANARRFRQRHGRVGLVVVDYVQRLDFASADRHDLQVGGAIKDLKTLAGELETTVVAVCQLNRGSEMRSNKLPQMSDLRDSGQLEQEADVVILLHRDDYYDKESPRAGEADFIVAKHRSGPTDTVTVAAQLHYSRFVDMAIT